MGFDPFFAASMYAYDDSAVACDPVEVPKHLVIGKTGTALPGCGHTDQQIREHTAKLRALTAANRIPGDLSTDFTYTSYGRPKTKAERYFGTDTGRVFKEVRQFKDTMLGLTKTNSISSITPSRRDAPYRALQCTQIAC
jgi:hypothetical protein